MLSLLVKTKACSQTTAGFSAEPSGVCKPPRFESPPPAFSISQSGGEALPGMVLDKPLAKVYLDMLPFHQIDQFKTFAAADCPGLPIASTRQ